MHTAILAVSLSIGQSLQKQRLAPMATVAIGRHAFRIDGMETPISNITATTPRYFDTRMQADRLAAMA